jgi:hypothetical protein
VNDKRKNTTRPAARKLGFWEEVAELCEGRLLHHAPTEPDSEGGTHSNTIEISCVGGGGGHHEGFVSVLSLTTGRVAKQTRGTFGKGNPDMRVHPEDERNEKSQSIICKKREVGRMQCATVIIRVLRIE